VRSETGEGEPRFVHRDARLAADDFQIQIQGKTTVIRSEISEQRTIHVPFHFTEINLRHAGNFLNAPRNLMPVVVDKQCHLSQSLRVSWPSIERLAKGLEMQRSRTPERMSETVSSGSMQIWLQFAQERVKQKPKHVMTQWK
jgi:hypothetical protein